jgi:Cu/Ag efflux protein CusF
MSPMTMVFQVKERSFLDKVKVGEKVNFFAEQLPGGGYAVTAIESAP